MARKRSVVRKAQGACRSADSQVIRNPELYRHSLYTKLPYGGYKAMMEQQALADKIEHDYRVNGTCDTCHTAKSKTGACWC